MFCLKKMPSLVDKSSIKKICVDDFALRKRFSYGTVMVDLESHRIVDLIPTRDMEAVKKWLDGFPNIEVVSRDGAQIYASAVINSHPEAIQVSDRFHIIKGLTEAIDRYLKRELPNKIEIPAVTPADADMQRLLNVKNTAQRIRFAKAKKDAGMTTMEIALILHASIKTVDKYLKADAEKVEERKILRERRHDLSVQQKEQEVAEARRMRDEGIPIERIAKELHHQQGTIKRYLDPNYSVVNGHYHARIHGKLAPYEKQILELRSQGVTYSKIHKMITEQGYCGSVASLRMFVQKERQRRGVPFGEETNSDYIPTEFIQRHSITTLLYKRTNELYSLSQAQYEKVIERYPMLAKLFGIVQEFYKMIYAKKSAGLLQWIEQVEELNIPELNTYANGIRRDSSAVTNGIELGYNNGLAEGSVNKIKVIKRIMYGRNSFELLKAKVLLQEQYRFGFN